MTQGPSVQTGSPRYWTTPVLMFEAIRQDVVHYVLSSASRLPSSYLRHLEILMEQLESQWYWGQDSYYMTESLCIRAEVTPRLVVRWFDLDDTAHTRALGEYRVYSRPISLR